MIDSQVNVKIFNNNLVFRYLTWHLICNPGNVEITLDWFTPVNCVAGTGKSTRKQGMYLRVEFGTLWAHDVILTS